MVFVILILAPNQNIFNIFPFHALFLEGCDFKWFHIKPIFTLVNTWLRHFWKMGSQYKDVILPVYKDKTVLSL